MIEGTITEEKRPIENPMDLLTFLLELLKALPYSVTKPFEIDSDASLLMYSPTHAFLLKPGLSSFKDGWLDKGFTYTWIRDHVIDPAKKYTSLELHGSVCVTIFSNTNSFVFCPGKLYSFQLADFPTFFKLLRFRNLQNVKNLYI